MLVKGQMSLLYKSWLFGISRGCAGWYSDCLCRSNLNANVANGANLTNKIYSRYSFIRGIRVKTGLVSKMNRFSHQFCLPHIWRKPRKLPKSLIYRLCSAP